jgi:hypothetical protein
MKKIVKNFLLNFLTIYFHDFFNIFKDIPSFLSQLRMKILGNSSCNKSGKSSKPCK